MLAALTFSLTKPRQVIIAGGRGDADTRALLREVHAKYLPNKILLMVDGEPDRARLGQRLKFIRGVKPIDGRATAYVCQDYTCKLPTNDPGTLRGLLDSR